MSIVESVNKEGSCYMVQRNRKIREGQRLPSGSIILDDSSPAVVWERLCASRGEHGAAGVEVRV